MPYTEAGFSCFPHEVEDAYIASISYVVDGEPKVGYVIARKHRSAFEELVAADV